jgi:CubicO group peptidase (beta-lactamase class C family)
MAALCTKLEFSTEFSVAAQNGISRRGLAATVIAGIATATAAKSNDRHSATPPPTPAPFRLASIADVRRFHTDPDFATLSDQDLERMHYAFTHAPEFARHSRLRYAAPPLTLPNRRLHGNALPRIPLRPGEDLLTLDAYMQHPASGADGLIVLRRGEILYEAYSGMRPDDWHILWSVTKIFTGTAIALLVDGGQIDPGAEVQTRLPALRGTGWDGVKIRDVLDMATGIEAREMAAGALSDPRVPYYRYEASLGTVPMAGLHPGSTYEVVASYKRFMPPGQVYDYSSVNTFVLAWLVEEITGLPLGEFIAANIWSRIGAEAEAALLMSPAGAPGADGGLSCCLRDAARFGLQFTNAIRRQTPRPLISDLYIANIRASRPALYAAALEAKLPGHHLPADAFGPEPPLCNSWQWDAVWPDGDMLKTGWGGQGLYVSPSTDIVIAYFGTRTPRGENRLRQYARGMRKFFSAR